MNKIHSGLLISVILLTGCASTEIKTQAQPQPQPQAKTSSLNNAELKALLVGKTLVGKIKGKGITSVINADGTVKGTYGATDADTGNYFIENNLYCSKWSRWAKGNKRCWSMSKQTNGYFAKAVSGGGSSFNFTVR